MDNGFVYLIDKKGKWHIGVTTDLENRMRQHGRKKPLYYEGPMPKAEAHKRKRELKGWSRKKKMSLFSEASFQQQ